MPELDGPRWGPATPPATSLVILCHGVGADGHDLIGLAPTCARAVPNAVFVAPNAPERYDMASMGRQWFSLADRTPAKLIAGAAAAADSLDRFIDAELTRTGLESYILVGFSQGAMTVLHTGLRRAARRPRGIVAISGAWLPSARIATDVPVLLVHGEDDAVVPVERSRMAEAALRQAGVAVQALYIPGLGHGIDDAGLSAGVRFLQRYLAKASAGVSSTG